MITYKRLREVLDYDPKTGVFTWRIARQRIRKGAKAGSLTKFYIQIKIDYKLYYAHRLAHLYMTGLWPIDEVDHRNGKKTDNRWSNLRESTRSLNMQNQRSAPKNSRTGVLGVSFRKNCSFNPWYAQIKINRKHKYLGSYATSTAAHTAYLEAKRQLHPWGTL